MDLTDHHPGYSVLLELYRLQANVPAPTGVAKFFGASPLLPDAISWYRGLLGEIQVGHQLNRLKDEGYLVLHGAPIGERGSDIDHVVFSPTGLVYTINTKNHENKKIRVYEHKIYVNGHPVDHVRNSRSENRRVKEKLLAADAGVTEVKSLLVFVNPQEIKKSGKTSDVTSLSSNELLGYIRKQNKKEAKTFTVIPPDYTPALDPIFWAKSYVDQSDTQLQREAWFKDFRAQVKSQSAKRMLWHLLYTVVGLGLLVGVGDIIYNIIL
jgi:hypothetical protein